MNWRGWKRSGLGWFDGDAGGGRGRLSGRGRRRRDRDLAGNWRLRLGTCRRGGRWLLRGGTDGAVPGNYRLSPISAEGDPESYAEEHCNSHGKQTISHRGQRGNLLQFVQNGMSRYCRVVQRILAVSRSPRGRLVSQGLDFSGSIGERIGCRKWIRRRGREPSGHGEGPDHGSLPGGNQNGRGRGIRRDDLRSRCGHRLRGSQRAVVVLAAIRVEQADFRCRDLVEQSLRKGALACRPGTSVRRPSVGRRRCR